MAQARNKDNSDFRRLQKPPSGWTGALRIGKLKNGDAGANQPMKPWTPVMTTISSKMGQMNLTS